MQAGSRDSQDSLGVRAARSCSYFSRRRLPCRTVSSTMMLIVPGIEQLNTQKLFERIAGGEEVASIACEREPFA